MRCKRIRGSRLLTTGSDDRDIIFKSRGTAYHGVRAPPNSPGQVIKKKLDSPNSAVSLHCFYFLAVDEGPRPNRSDDNIFIYGISLFFNMWYTFSLFLFGAAGAIVKDILADNSLVMPKILSGKLQLGFLGSVFIGASAGYFVDHSPITAFFAGYAGFHALAALMPKSLEQVNSFAAEKMEPAKPAEISEPITIKSENTEKTISIIKPFENNYKITQNFGENPDWYKANGYAGHFGLDFATPYGTRILACDDGEVIRAGFTAGNGNFCELQHSWGSSLYLHFKEPACVTVGQQVKKGENVGFAGNTGAVIPTPTKENPLAGTHLHFSIKINGVLNPDYKNFVDPLPFLQNLL